MVKVRFIILILIITFNSKGYAQKIVSFSIQNGCIDTLKLVNLTSQAHSFSNYKWVVRIKNRDWDTTLFTKHGKLKVNNGDSIVVKLIGINTAGAKRKDSLTQFFFFKEKQPSAIQIINKDGLCPDDTLKATFKLIDDDLEDYPNFKVKWTYSGAGFPKITYSNKNFELVTSNSGRLYLTINFFNGYCYSDTSTSIEIDAYPEAGIVIDPKYDTVCAGDGNLHKGYFIAETLDTLNVDSAHYLWSNGNISKSPTNLFIEHGSYSCVQTLMSKNGF